MISDVELLHICFVLETADFTHDEINDYLEHFGVKGMRWGIRKDRPGATGYTTAPTNIAFSKHDMSLAKKTMTVSQLHEKVSKPINPGYGERGTKLNCRRCTFAYEMRRRGYDVRAGRTTKPNKDQTGYDLHKIINPNLPAKLKYHDKLEILKSGQAWGTNQIADPSMKTILNTLSKEPNHSRGELSVAWKMGGGHSMAYEVVNKKAVIFDNQNGKMYTKPSPEAEKFFKHAGFAAYTRLDNKNLTKDIMDRYLLNN